MPGKNLLEAVVMKKIEALIPHFKIDEIKEALLSLEEFQDMTISDVMSFSSYNNSTAFYRGVAFTGLRSK